MTIAQLLKHDFKKGVLRLYDSNNNLMYYEQESDGFWIRNEYDSNGNEIYFESSNGYWYKQEYDSNGNEIYYENSDGFWIKNEYDSNNNKIYYENSNGDSAFIVDNRPKPSCEGKIVEIDGKKYK